MFFHYVLNPKDFKKVFNVKVIEEKEVRSVKRNNFAYYRALVKIKMSLHLNMRHAH
jgi:hypothetical protein